MTRGTQSSMEDLNSHWARKGIVFQQGPGGLPIAILSRTGSEAVVALHGAHVLSYKPARSQAVLWQSAEAVYRDGKAIRGGIPICWPWFADHPSEADFPAHGIARTQAWNITRTTQTDSGSPSISLSLSASEETRALFPHTFQLSYTVTLSDVLAIRFTVSNPGIEPFTYTGALHSYFNISQIARIRIAGLEGVDYVDSLDGARRKRQDGPIRFDAEVDRIYVGTEGTCEIVDEAWARTISVRKRGSRSTVVWNPWIAKARRMADFGDAEYRKMVCVETANAADDAVTLPPGETHTVELELAVLP